MHNCDCGHGKWNFKLFPPIEAQHESIRWIRSKNRYSHRIYCAFNFFSSMQASLKSLSNFPLFYRRKDGFSINCLRLFFQRKSITINVLIKFVCFSSALFTNLETDIQCVNGTFWDILLCYSDTIEVLKNCKKVYEQKKMNFFDSISLLFRIWQAVCLSPFTLLEYLTIYTEQISRIRS